jgi:uncharacterized paraquat-inducible protein A
MNSYTVCARTGCDHRVAYNRATDLMRHRYCQRCENEIGERLRKSKKCTDADIVAALMILVVNEC